MVVEQKVTSMTTLKIKSYLLGPILNNFQRGLGKKILPFHFLNLHHEFGNSFFSKFWHINQKKFMKQKRQQIDHRVAWRRPFLRFQLHFWDIVAGATHRRGRSNPPKVCLPPLVEPSLSGCIGLVCPKCRHIFGSVNHLKSHLMGSCRNNRWN